MAKGDTKILDLWSKGKTLEALATEFAKTPTSIAHKVVRLGLCKDRTSVNLENQKRGGGFIASKEHDDFYTVYVVRNPHNKNPIYVGQTQNFKKRIKNHLRRFSKHFNGEMPIIEELKTVADYAKARNIEKLQIAKLSSQGFLLLNVLDRDLCKKTNEENIVSTMRLNEQLKLLAKGIHPETGEVLDDDSLTNKPETIRLLYDLAEEILQYEKPNKTKQKLQPEERRQKNISEGKPPKSHFPWSDEEKRTLEEAFKNNSDVVLLANRFERSILAVAVQLQKLALISEEEFESYRWRQQSA